MTDSTEELGEKDRRALIESFELSGYATFRIGEDRAAFDTLMQYVRKHMIPTLTDVDESAGIVTITRRPMGSLELG